MDNPFLDKMAQHSDLALFQVLKQKDDYQSMAVEAAENELNKRNLADAEKEHVFAKIDNIEAEKRRKQQLIDNIKEKAVNLREYITNPSNLKSPTTIINAVERILSSFSSQYRKTGNIAHFQYLSWS